MINFNNNNAKKEMQFSLQIKNVSGLKLLFSFLLLTGVSYTIFYFISQIYFLNVELKNLVFLVQSLQENQVDLKNQLLVKDQKINLLETNLKTLDLSALSSLDTASSFEKFKKEVMQNNNEISQFYVKTTVAAVCCAILIYKCLKWVF